MKILVINGPNLNLLGKREPHIYGTTTLEAIEAQLQEEARLRGVALEFFQSNHEGALIDRLQAAREGVDAVIINPGALTHYSLALRDALLCLQCPVVEVHLTNVYRREEFRQHMVTTGAVTGVIGGFGPLSYRLALLAAIELVRGGGTNCSRA